MTSTPTTRASLLFRLRDSQDHEAWVEFVEIYEPAVYRQLRKCGLQDADARELMQELSMVWAARERISSLGRPPRAGTACLCWRWRRSS